MRRHLSLLRTLPDVNPTPTRFLLECGAFTPGLSLNLENYNPFDASLKFLNTGTPKAELNPFDTSFRTPPSLSVKTSAQSSLGTQQENERQRSSLRHPWADMMFDEVSMPAPQMSPGLSPSSSSLSASPSPPISSPPLPTISLEDFGSSMNATQHHASQVHAYNHDAVFEKLYQSEVGAHAAFLSHSPPVRETLAPSEILARPPSSSDGYQPDNSEDDDESVDQQRDLVECDSVNDQEPIGRYDDSGMDIAMSALAMRRQSVMSDVELAAFDHTSQNSSSSNHTMVNRSVRTSNRISKKDTNTEPAPTTKTTSSASGSSSSRKGKGTTMKTGSRKRSSAEQETPEAKRQKFLERNRMAASKCREKKRLQTLKTISDADEITARNQALHETLDQLQEEVRQLKNQILCHRDCGCDVIQKFVKSSFAFGTSSSSPTTAAPRLSMYQ